MKTQGYFAAFVVILLLIATTQYLRSLIPKEGWSYEGQPIVLPEEKPEPILQAAQPVMQPAPSPTFSGEDWATIVFRTDARTNSEIDRTQLELGRTLDETERRTIYFNALFRATAEWCSGRR